MEPEVPDSHAFEPGTSTENDDITRKESVEREKITSNAFKIYTQARGTVMYTKKIACKHAKRCR
mgnify:CR=1 FL=1